MNIFRIYFKSNFKIFEDIFEKGFDVSWVRNLSSKVIDSFMYWRGRSLQRSFSLMGLKNYHFSEKIITTLQSKLQPMFCVLIFSMNGGNLQLKVNPKKTDFWGTFHDKIIYSQSFCWEVTGDMFFRISFYLKFLTWNLNLGLASNETFHYLLDWTKYICIFN